MGTIAVLLAGTSIVLFALCIRDLAALAATAAAGFWLLPIVVGGPDMPAGFEAVEELQPAPPAEFKSAAGKPLTLEDFRGQVVLLNFWSTACAPCQEETPSFDRLQAMYGGDGLTVLPISIDGSSGSVLRRYFQRNGLRNLTPYLDVDKKTTIAFSAYDTPTTLLIDRDGNVVGSLVGAVQWDSPEAIALIRRYLDS